MELIVNEPESKFVSMEDLQNGDFFLFGEGNLGLKLNNSMAYDRDSIYYKDMQTNEICYFKDTTLVFPVTVVSITVEK